ncbi:hypothetical protein [Paracoccus beibuensis]|uniref:hypothetical protein n=1 Tax=Paracoccus beibuensis TaxID=547602 RepID=UPI00223FDB68|nr:hypothetical protein [Paracoccus beibuensis]
MTNSDQDAGVRDLQREFAPLRQSLQQMPLSEEVRALVARLRLALQALPRN